MNRRALVDYIVKKHPPVLVAAASSGETDQIKRIQKRFDTVLIVSLLGAVSILVIAMWPVRTLGDLLALGIGTVLIIVVAAGILAATVSAFLSLFSIALVIQRAAEIKRKEAG